MSTEFYSLELKEKRRETEQAVSLIWNVPTDLKQEFQYKAGQYLTIKATINGESVRRAYSISTNPKEEELKVSVKLVDGGKMSNFLINDLQEGDRVEVMQAQGTFTLEKKSDTVGFFAAGSGITPVISLIKECIQNNCSKISLHFGNRTEADAMFKSELDQLAQEYPGFEVQYHYSSQGQRIDSSAVKNHAMNGMCEQYFICGPEGFNEEIKNALLNLGLKDEDAHIEFFASPKSESNEGTSAAEVSGEIADVELIIDDEHHKVSLNPQETLLEAGERIGIDPPFSCQSGVCTTCRAKVIKGKVDMENNFGLSQDEIDEGFVLTCIGKPVSPGVVVSWDEQ